MERRENGLVDIVKFICAVVVVAGHCYLSDADGMGWYMDLVKLAVQIFFIFSGYFLVAAGTLEQEGRATSYVRHLLWMTVLWMAVYFLVNLAVTDRVSDVWVYDFITLWTQFFTSFDSGHLWYLQNLFLVVVILLGLKKTRFSWKEVLFWLVFGSVFYGRITRAVLGIAVGIFLAATVGDTSAVSGGNGAGKKTSNGDGAAASGGSTAGNAGGRLLIGMGVFAVAGGAIGLLGHNSAVVQIMHNYVGNLASIIIAWCALCGRLPGEGRVNFVYLRKQSTLVYLIHSAFVPFVAKLMSSVFAAWIPAAEKGVAWCLILTTVVLICSLIAGGVILALSRHERFRWLKKLY